MLWDLPLYDCRLPGSRPEAIPCTTKNFLKLFSANLYNGLIKVFEQNMNAELYREEFIRKIDFLKCFDSALENNNEKIAKYLLKILSYYTFNTDSKWNNINFKFNLEFLNMYSLKGLKFLKKNTCFV
jgi:hypothetical protein